MTVKTYTDEKKCAEYLDALKGSRVLAKYKDKIRADAIDECIEKLAKSDDTILSDRQYYTLMELKEQKK